MSVQERSEQSHRGDTFRAWVELFRLTNLPTAWADPICGFLLAAPESWSLWPVWAAAVVVLASSAFYTAGMVLNDVFDYPEDRCHSPERPLPSGRIGVRVAKRVGWALWSMGLGLSLVGTALVNQAAVMLVGGLLAAAVVAYDAGAKRTWAGPVVMGSCRALNLLLGAGIWGWPGAVPLVAAGALGLYVTGLTLFARPERQKRISPWALLPGWLVLLAGFVLLAALPLLTPLAQKLSPSWVQRWWTLVGVLALMASWRCVWAMVVPEGATVRRAVGVLLLSLIVFDAAAVALVRGGNWALGLLALLVPTLILRRWSKPT